MKTVKNFALHHAGAALLTAGLLGFIAGCATPAPLPAPKAAQSAQGRPAIAQGMTADEVVRRIGRPLEVRPVQSDVPAEVWVYRRDAGSISTMNATTTSEVPVADPFTGQISTVPQLEYRPERVDAEQQTELLMVEGRLVSWKQRLVKSHHYE
jgi:hypothetical protein